MNKIIYNDESLEKILSGVNKINNAVKITMGPKGKNVILYQPDLPLITNDGVTIAKNVESDDPFENLAISCLKQSSIKTCDIAGDGTTTAIVLTSAIVNNAIKHIKNGASNVLIRNGLNKACNYLSNELTRSSKKVINTNDIKSVATVSSGSVQVGELISNAYNKIGLNGILSLEEGKTNSTELSIVEGMKIERGAISPYMLSNDGNKHTVIENALILIKNSKINTFNELIPILEYVAKQNKPLLIICDDIENDVVNAVTLNKMRGIINCFIIKSPSFGENRYNLLCDISILTNAKIIDNINNNSCEECMGECTKIEIDMKNTLLINKNADQQKINNYIENLKLEIANEKDEFSKSRLQSRLCSLSGGVGIIKVGAYAELEMLEIKLRLEDAIAASTSAISSGVVAGGGIALIKLYNKLKKFNRTLSGDEKIGAEILLEAITSPLIQICENSGENGVQIKNKILSYKGKIKNYGYDALNKRFCNMIEQNIIDPCAVTLSALNSACSIAGTLITTSVMIV